MRGATNRMEKFRFRTHQRKQVKISVEDSLGVLLYFYVFSILVGRL